MGHRMSDVPHIYGDDCLRGWDAGETPKYLYVRFSEIIKCPDLPPVEYEIPPNDRVFKLTQDETWPCLWEITTTGWHVIVDLQFDPPHSIFWMEHVPDGRVYFYNVTDAPLDEGFVYHNDIFNCLLGRPAKDGFATVTWMPETTNLLKSINMQQADDLFMEMRPLDNGNKVFKFCRLRDATNISILFNPS